MPRQEGRMMKLGGGWKGCWKKGGSSANFRRWASKLDQVASSSMAVIASKSASYSLFSLGILLTVYLVFASMLYDVPSSGFNLDQLLSFDLSGAADISLQQDTLKVEELFGKDPLRQDLLVKPRDGGSVTRKDIFDSIWLLHGEIENVASGGGAPANPGMCVAAEGSSACTPPGALAYWSSAQEYMEKVNSDEDLLTSLQAAELSDGRPVVPSELFGGYEENGIPGSKAVLLSYFLNASATEEKLHSWENAIALAKDLSISNINVEVRTPIFEETLKHALPWVLCSLSLYSLTAGVLCSKSLKIWKSPQSRLLLGLISSIIGALGGIGAVGVCIATKIGVDETALFLVPALCTLITLHSLTALTMVMDEVKLMLPGQHSVSALLQVTTKVTFLPIALPLLSMALAVALCASGLNIPGLPIEMPFPYAIQGWLWALFGGLISSLLSSFVALPGLIALDEERQARHRLELLFCCAPKAAAQLELQSQSQNRSSQGYEFFSKKVGNILLGRVSGKAILGLGLALFGATGWFYNTSRLEMDFFSVPWPMLEQKLAPLSNVASFWAEAQAENLARGENWARATIVEVLSDNRTGIESIDSWLPQMMKWCEEDALPSICDEDSWESSENSFYNSITLFLSSSIGKRYATDFVAAISNSETELPQMKAARTHLWQGSISQTSIDAVREILVSAVDLNPNIFPFLVVQSSDYVWYDAMDGISAAARRWDILFCGIFGCFSLVFLGIFPSVIITVLCAAVAFWGMVTVGTLLSGFKMDIFEYAAIFTISPLTLTCGTSAVIAFAQHPLGVVSALEAGEKIRSRIGTWGVPTSRICIITAVGALPLALSSGQGVIFKSVFTLVCGVVFGLLISVLVMWPLLSCLFGFAIMFASAPTNRQNPKRWWHYLCYRSSTTAITMKNEATARRKLGNQGSLSDMFREKEMTPPKHVYGGNNDGDSYDDNDSQETNAIPTSIIQQHGSIEDDRPLGATEGGRGCDTLSMTSTPPPSPPHTPYPWQNDETDAFSCTSMISKPYVDDQKTLPNVSPKTGDSSSLSPISRYSTSHDIHNDPAHIPITSVLIQNSTPPLQIDSGLLPAEEKEPNSSEPLSFTPPPPPPPLPYE